MWHWYAVQWKPYQDQRAEINLQDPNYEVFCLLAKASKHKNGLLAGEIRFLFNRYLFTT